MPPTYWPPLTDALFRQFSTPPVVPYSWPTMAAMPYLLELLVTSTRPSTVTFRTVPPLTVPNRP